MTRLLCDWRCFKPCNELGLDALEVRARSAAAKERLARALTSIVLLDQRFTRDAPLRVAVPQLGSPGERGVAEAIRRMHSGGSLVDLLQD